VLVAGLDGADEDGEGRLELGGSADVADARSQGHYLGREGEFFADFAEDGLDGVFVGLDVATGGQPGLDLAVPVQGRAAIVDDEASWR
jgi:hypothetical protein